MPFALACCIRPAYIAQMARELEKAVVALVARLLLAQVDSTVPPWLKRPGKLDCGGHWPLIRRIYADLQRQDLPEVAPAHEWRRVDAVLIPPNGKCFVLEVDEAQHFNEFRRLTLERYPAAATLRFDKQEWIRRCNDKRVLERAGFARPKPPLFPGENGRHRQRAFRDALTDLLPPLHGYAPTLRIADFEVADWIGSVNARSMMTALLRARGLR